MPLKEEKTPTRQDAQDAIGEAGIHAHKTGTYDGSTPPNARSSDRKGQYSANKDKEDKFGKLVQLAALGITLAIAVKIASMSMNHWLATNGATVKFTSIVANSPLPSWLPSFLADFLKKYIKSKTLRISYTVTAAGTDDNAIPDVLASKSQVRLTNYDTISVDAGTTGLSYLDGQTISIAQVPSQGVFIFDAGTDVTGVNVSNKGTGVINSSYDEQVGEETAQTATDISSVISRTVGPLFNNLGTIAFYVIFFLIIYFIIQIVSSFSSR